jgi:hypothetical protein
MKSKIKESGAERKTAIEDSTEMEACEHAYEHKSVVLIRNM